MERKTLPHYIKAIEGRTVTGIMAVHGVIDDGGDRSWMGSFLETIAERVPIGRVKWLWTHCDMEPPTAKVDSAREVGPADLPPLVLQLAPMATGGVEVTRTYLKSQRADDILEGLQANAINELSYAYDPLEFSFTADQSAPWGYVRELRKVKWYEGSDVNFGMNPATVAEKTADLLLDEATHALIPDALARVFTLTAARIEGGAKEGRVLSAANIEKLQNALDALQEVLKAAQPADDGKAARAAQAQAALRRKGLALDLELQLAARRAG